jgi:hypothetical protein
LSRPLDMQQDDTPTTQHSCSQGNRRRPAAAFASLSASSGECLRVGVREGHTQGSSAMLQQLHHSGIGTYH